MAPARIVIKVYQGEIEVHFCPRTEQSTQQHAFYHITWSYSGDGDAISSSNSISHFSEQYMNYLSMLDENVYASTRKTAVAKSISPHSPWSSCSRNFKGNIVILVGIRGSANWTSLICLQHRNYSCYIYILERWRSLIKKFWNSDKGKPPQKPGENNYILLKSLTCWQSVIILPSFHFTALNCIWLK